MSVVEKKSPLTTEHTVVIGQRGFGARTTDALRAAINGLPDRRAVVVDLANLDALDERGIGVLLAAAHRLYEDGRALIVQGANAAVRAHLRAVGLHRWAAIA